MHSTITPQIAEAIVKKLEQRNGELLSDLCRQEIEIYLRDQKIRELESRPDPDRAIDQADADLHTMITNWAAGAGAQTNPVVIDALVTALEARILQEFTIR